MTSEGISLNNPAGRLFSVLSRAKTSGASTYLLAYSHAFDVPRDDVSQIFLKLGQLGLAIDEIIEQMKLIDSKHLNTYLESVPHLKAAVSVVQLAMNWDSGRSIRDEDLRALKYCSTDLSEFSREEELSHEQIQELKTDVDEIYEKVLKTGELDRELKRVVLEHLEAIRRAIHDYRIRGIRPVIEAVGMTAFVPKGLAKIQHVGYPDEVGPRIPFANAQAY